jgi:dTDP-4-amino-4,6-dideoxygalactose transaminase
MWAELEEVYPVLEKQGYEVENPWDVVRILEEKVAAYAGSKYAVAVDNCTDAMFLCLKYLGASGEITIPSKTYVSVPATIINAGCSVKFVDKEWSGTYKLEPYNVIDSATRFQKNMYVKGSLQCLSFHLKKILKLGKGGMILTDDKDAYNWLQSASKMGRHIDRLYVDDYFDIICWNMFMPPEQAAKAILLFEEIPDFNEDCGGSWRYHDLKKYDVFTNPEKSNKGRKRNVSKS